MLTSKSRHPALVQRAAEHIANAHPTAGMREITIGNRWSLLAFHFLMRDLCSVICTLSLLETVVRLSESTAPVFVESMQTEAPYLHRAHQRQIASRRGSLPVSSRQSRSCNLQRRSCRERMRTYIDKSVVRCATEGSVKHLSLNHCHH